MTVRRLGSTLVAGLIAFSLLLTTQIAPAWASSGAGRGAATAGLATSLTTSDGTWALLPMEGFWELFLLPSGGSVWSLQTPPGVADNGGLVLSGGSPGRLLVGFRPSQNLKYSPLAATEDGGRSWTAGIFPSALGRVPDALAVSGSGRLMALSQLSGGAIWASQGPGRSWARVTTLAAISRSAGLSRCDPAALTAVAFTPAGSPLVGIDCRRGGVVGILSVSGDHPRLMDLPLAEAQRAETMSVLRLTTTAEGVVGLVLAQAGSRSALLAVWEGPSGAWSLSPALAIGTASVASTLIGPGLSLGVVLAARSSSLASEIIQGPGSGWWRLPAAPAADRVVAAGSDGEVDALGTRGDALKVWRLLPGAGSWTDGQTLKVPIQAGSSS